MSEQNFYKTDCLGSCNPPQIISLNYAINDISTISIMNNCEEYDKSQLEYSYSIDNICYSCYMTYDEALSNTINLNSDFYLRIKVKGVICSVLIDNIPTQDYNVQLDNGFNFSTEENSNTYNPYTNLDTALQLQQQLTENVSNIVGIPVYYFKLSPNATSKDLTFKEYALMDVESVKQIKLVIADGQMPSSKPEFADWGMEFQTDWETEITKQSFATAFGINAQPLEGDLIYIPMMKRMWMVNGAYEEKNGSLMWQATTFKIMLVKYQEKGSVDLGDTEQLVNSFVKNKYEDLFGEDNYQTYDSGENSTESPLFAQNALYPIFESDATRKYVTCKSIDIIANDIYYRGTLISDSKYTFNRNDIKSRIIYQQQFCGDELSCSFIIKPLIGEYENEIIHIGNISIIIKQEVEKSILYINANKNFKLELIVNNNYLCILRISKCMNLIDFSAYEYTYNDNIPIYKLQKNHYWFNMDNPYQTNVSKYDIEFTMHEKSEIWISNFYGEITNFKIFDIYNDNLSDMLQMYPTNQHLIINDTARKIVGNPGVLI